MNSSFLQSPEWGQFQERVGVKTQILLVAGAQIQVLVYPTPVGNFWYVPHAQVPSESYEKLAVLAKQQGEVIFIRIEPQEPLPVLPISAHRVKNRQPTHTVILNLLPPVPDILAAMHQKTRYSIRVAEEKDLKISWEKNAQVFHSLLIETATRDKFNPHSREYYEKMLACPLVEQVTVYLENKPLASSIFIGYQKTFTYLHSASSSEHREAMASYLIQWTAIQWAKAKGFVAYDFWGVAPDGDEQHALSGVTRFKIRFGGQRYQYGAAFELPIINWRYQIFNFLKKLRL